MRLRRARVQNYRAIVDSGIVDIHDRVTVLIGKNEQGKTTFLKGLASANGSVKYTPADYPNHMRAELEQKVPAEVPVVTLWLSPDSVDHDQLNQLGLRFDEDELLQVSKFFDGHRTFSHVRPSGPPLEIVIGPPDISAEVSRFRELANLLKQKLTAHGERHGEFNSALPQAHSRIDEFLTANLNKIDQIENLVSTLATGLTSVPGQDAPIQEDIAASIRDLEGVHGEIKRLMEINRTALIENLLPQFILHSTAVDKIPNTVEIGPFVANPDETSKGMANLCRVAGLTMAKIQELANTSDTSTRETFEDHYKGNVSGGINEYWTQESYQVHFRFDRERMSVSISDSTYSPRIRPTDRSDGFQWYLSFYAALLSEVSSPRPIVFALDNPGLELHADGQRDIKRVLEEKLPANAQVIYVTHSPAMIDPFNLEQVRQVELKPDRRGTKVTRLAFKEGKDFDLLEPVRSAIGASIATSLIMNDYNILVEGAADKPILEGAFQRLQPDRAKKIVVNGSVSESPDGFLVRFYQQANVPFVVYVDADSAGRQIANSLRNNGISDSNIIPLEKIIDVPSGHDMELEDVISHAFYHSAVRKSYPKMKIDGATGNSGKRTKYYEKQFKEKHGIGFNKRRVGDQLKQLLLTGKADEETETNLKKVTDSLLAVLDNQVKR